MKVGDIVDDGQDNIGIIVELGKYYGCGLDSEPAYLVHFPDTTQNGWYSDDDLEAL
tara:strand:- start:511 stop:678 length:168 start_codon:yes stop_codon:yes gene_type:complete